MILSLLGRVAAGETDFDARAASYLGPYITRLPEGSAVMAKLRGPLLAGTRREWHDMIEAEFTARWFQDMGKHPSGQAEKDRPVLSNAVITKALARMMEQGDVRSLQSLLWVLDRSRRGSAGEGDADEHKILKHFMLAQDGAVLETVVQGGHVGMIGFLLDVLAAGKRKKGVQDILGHNYFGARLVLAAARGNHDAAEKRIWDFFAQYGMEAKVMEDAAQSLLYYHCRTGDPAKAAQSWERCLNLIGPEKLADAVLYANGSLVTALFTLADQKAVPVLLQCFAADCPREKVTELYTRHWEHILKAPLAAESLDMLLGIAEATGGKAFLQERLRAEQGRVWVMAAAQKDDAPLRKIYGYGGDEGLRAVARAPRFLQDVILTGSPEGVMRIADMVRQAAGDEPVRRMLQTHDSVGITARLDYAELLRAMTEIAKKVSAPGVAMAKGVVDLLAERREGRIGTAEYWQCMGGGVERWKAVARCAPPEGVNEYWSPYGFKPKLFSDLREALAPVDVLEGTDLAASSAFKLSVLFANKEEVERYLGRAVSKAAPEHGRSPVARACDFELPLRGMWDRQYWKNMVLKFDRGATRYLGMAAEVESYCADNLLPLPQNVAGLRDIAARIIYKRADENPELAKLALEHALQPQLFEKALRLLQEERKKEDRMPSVMIDGAQVGRENYYMEKLDPADPRGLLLGRLTNNCQYLGGNGEYAAVLGVTSPDSGFYVWKQKSKGAITPDDRIVAQSWVWRAADGKSVVFDSFERLSPAYDGLAQPFLEQFAYDLKKAGTLSRVFLGAGGGTPQTLGLRKTTKPVQPLVPFAMQDSVKQYVIRPVDHRGRQPG